MALNDIVQITVSVQTTTPSRVGFGTPLIMAYHSVFPERAREYTSVAAMITDGFATTDQAVRCAGALFAQDPAPSKVVVGREENTSKMKINVEPDPADIRDLYDYVVYLNGLEAKFTSDATATAIEITAGLKIAIDALAQPVTVTDNVGDLDIEANTIADAFYFYVEKPEILLTQDVTPDAAPAGIVADIIAVQLTHDDWYSLCLTNLGKAAIKAAAAYIETLTKIMIVATLDSDCYDAGSTTDVAAELKAAGYDRTGIMRHAMANVQYPGAGWQGRCLPEDPGSFTWKFKSLSGVSVENYTSTKIAALETKNCNTYTAIGSETRITQQGVMASGEYIDVIRGIDFLKARMQEYIFAALANAKKIPYTDAGVGMVEAQVWAVLRLCVKQEILAASPEPTVTVPLVADVSVVDKGNRLLPDVKFEATLAGAIHSVVIQGTVVL